MSDQHSIPGSMRALEVIRQVLDLRGSTIGFEITATSHGFNIVRRGETEATGRISHEGLLLTARGKPEKTVTDINATWDFIEGHLRNVVPRVA